jgi:hypothetical protein
MGGPFVGVDGVGALMLSECDRPPYAPVERIRVRATVITSNGERTRLDGVCRSRKDMDDLVERLYPDARMVSMLVHREATPC